jgi:hypothetical protein
LKWGVRERLEKHFAMVTTPQGGERVGETFVSSTRSLSMLSSASLEKSAWRTTRRGRGLSVCHELEIVLLVGSQTQCVNVIFDLLILPGFLMPLTAFSMVVDWQGRTHAQLKGRQRLAELGISEYGAKAKNGNNAPIETEGGEDARSEEERRGG